MLTLLLALLPITQASSASDYPRKEMLVQPADLPSFLKQQGKLRIVDVRSKEAYEKGHLEHAARIDHDTWSKSFGDGSDSKAWQKLIGEAGISELKNPILIYDDGTITNAARVWFILRYWGCEDVRLINGGFKSIQTSGIPLTQSISQFKAEVFPDLSATEKRLAKKENLLDLLKSKGEEQIVDARSDGEYTGTTQNAKRGGTIPGCRHLDWTQLIDKETRQFKKASELRKLFDAAGIDLSRPSVSFCQSGGRASVMAFCMELMGGTSVRNYYRSWSEWGNDPDTPIEKGSLKK